MLLLLKTTDTPLESIF